MKPLTIRRRGLASGVFLGGVNPLELNLNVGMN